LTYFGTEFSRWPAVATLTSPSGIKYYIRCATERLDPEKPTLSTVFRSFGTILAPKSSEALVVLWSHIDALETGTSCKPPTFTDVSTQQPVVPPLVVPRRFVRSHSPTDWRVCPPITRHCFTALPSLRHFWLAPGLALRVPACPKQEWPSRCPPFLDQ